MFHALQNKVKVIQYMHYVGEIISQVGTATASIGGNTEREECVCV